MLRFIFPAPQTPVLVNWEMKDHVFSKYSDFKEVMSSVQPINMSANHRFLCFYKCHRLCTCVLAFLHLALYHIHFSC